MKPDRIEFYRHAAGRNVPDKPCASCQAKAVPRPMISICINTQNEGPRLAATVRAFHEHLADWPHEFVIIADEVTDGCCDGLEKLVGKTRLVILRNEKRIGCGRCKRLVIAHARGEVLVFLDAHMNVLAGSLARMACRAAVEDAIFTPVIHDIRYDDEWRMTDRTKRGLHEVPCDQGMRFEKSQYAKAKDSWIRDHHLAEIRMPGVGFAISRKTIERLGGFNAYHGLHGSQERGIALRAFMAKVPVKLYSEVILGHEFRAGRPKPKGFKRWSTRGQSKNFWHAYFIVAGDAAWKRIAPILKRKARGGQSVTQAPSVIEERKAFADKKRRSDDDLLKMLGISSGGTAHAGEDGPPLRQPARSPSTVDAIYGVPIAKLPEEMIARWRAAEKLGAGVVQHPAELARAWTRVRDTAPEAFLEIGSESGGALYVYAGACAKGTRIVAVDDGRTPKHQTTLKRIVDQLRKEDFKANIVFGDSHADETQQAALGFLKEAKEAKEIGFLHIDGDHSEKGALRDWKDYAPLVRPGGLIAVHDIDMPAVRKAWKTIKGTCDRRYLRDVNSGPFGDHQAMGVGLYRVPPKPAIPEPAADAPREVDLPVQSDPKIDVRIAFEPGGRIGADYNRIMRESAHEWVLFIDHDVLLLHPSWYQVAQHAIRTHTDAGIFTCWTNRIACKHQLDTGAPAGHDIEDHRVRARELWNQHGLRCSLNRRWLIAGFFLLTSKTAWRKSGGFPEDGFFGVDNEYHRRVMRTGLKCYRVDGLYCYHIRDRKGRAWATGVHTSADLARNRSLIEMKRSTTPPKPAAPPAPRRDPPTGRRCVYTVMTGGYDQLLTPRCVAPGWDFIAFVDDPDAVRSPHWQLRKLDAGDLDVQAASRLPKILPHRFLADYEFSLYLDANMRLRGRLENLGRKHNWPIFCSVRHPWRSCVYQELRQIANLRKAPVAAVSAQIARYEAEGIPGDLGLYENGFLLRRHNDPEAIAIDEAWWKEYMQSETRRDQPALAVALWRLGKTIESVSCTERTRWVRLLKHRALEKKSVGAA